MNAPTLKSALQSLQDLPPITLQLLRLQALGRTADYADLVSVASFSDCPTFAQMALFRQIVGQNPITVQLLDAKFLEAKFPDDTNQYITLLGRAAFSDTPVFAQQDAYNKLMVRAKLNVA